MAPSRRELLWAHAAAKPGAVEDHPWGDDAVFKVGGKIFFFVSAAGHSAAWITVSCGVDAEEWRRRYPDSISVARYIGRYGWNTVRTDGDGCPSMDELRELVDASYDIVVAKLPKAARPR